MRESQPITTVGGAVTELGAARGFTVHEKGVVSQEMFEAHLQEKSRAVVAEPELLKGGEARARALANPELLKNPALRYMRSHGVDVAGDVGITTSKNGTVFVTVPYRTAGVLTNIVAISVNSEKPIRRYMTAVSDPFGLEALRAAGEMKEVVVLENELDVLAYRRATGEPAISFPIDRLQPLRPEWLGYFKDAESIVFVTTTAFAETRVMFERARQLGVKRVKVALLPRDVDSVGHMLFVSDAEAVLDMVRLAEPYKLPSVASMADGLDALAAQLNFPDEDRVRGLMRSSHMNVLRIMTPCQPGDLVGVIAEPKVGKTTFSLQELVEAAAAGTPAFYGCSEMPIEALAEKVVQFSFGVPAPIVDPVIIEEARLALGKLQLYLAELRGYDYRNIDELIAFYRDVIRTYGVRVCAYDHIHNLIAGSRNPEGDTAKVIQKFKELAMDERIVFIALIQPTKGDEERDVTIRHGKYSGLIAAMCDKAIALNRRELKDNSGIDEDGIVYGARAPLTKIKVEGRLTRGGTTYLMFEEAISKFRSLTPDELAEIRSAAEKSDGNSRRNPRG